ncbi:MAG: M15 family metallopeptidase [Kofleriaceae bacterium]
MTTVGSFVSSGCSTAVVRGLSIQIAEEVDCSSPSSLVHFEASTKVKFSSNAVLPYLHSRARTDLLAVSGTLNVNSAYRTVAQQYLLYRWWQAGRCGITAAATPGRSNHESGRAIDLANWSARRASMAAHHWAHDVPGDAVHFDNTRSPDNRGLDVRAFQRLWNRNHPTDKITVDGDYGPQTAARLKKSPAKGFAKGASCRVAIRGAQILAIDGPDRVAPGEAAHYAFTIANTEEVDWPVTARVVVDGGVPSALAAPSWVSPSEPGTLATAIAAGGDGVFDLDVVAPAEAGEHAAVFALLDGDRQIGTFELAFTVTMDGAGTSGEADDVDDIEDVDADEDGVVTGTGGCSTSGGAGAGLLLVVAMFVLRRRQA